MGFSEPDERAVVCPSCGHTIGYRAVKPWTDADRALHQARHDPHCPGAPPALPSAA